MAGVLCAHHLCHSLPPAAARGRPGRAMQLASGASTHMCSRMCWPLTRCESGTVGGSNLNGCRQQLKNAGHGPTYRTTCQVVVAAASAAGGAGRVAARRQRVQVLAQHVGRDLAWGAGLLAGAAQCRCDKGGCSGWVRALRRHMPPLCAFLGKVVVLPAAGQHVPPAGGASHTMLRLLRSCITLPFPARLSPTTRLQPGQLHAAVPGRGLAGPGQLALQQAVCM